MATATPSGKMEHFIVGNTRKEKKKDMDFKRIQMEIYMTGNGNKTREQEMESSNRWQQGKPKDVLSNTTESSE
jgi:hypothetical protein